MTSSNSARPPEPLRPACIAEKFGKNFKREWSYYEIAAGIASKTEMSRGMPYLFIYLFLPFIYIVSPRESTMVQLDRGGHGYQVQILVVENCGTPLLSLATSKQFGLVNIIESGNMPKPQVSSHIRQVRFGT